MRVSKSTQLLLILLLGLVLLSAVAAKDSRGKKSEPAKAKKASKQAAPLFDIDYEKLLDSAKALALQVGTRAYTSVRGFVDDLFASVDLKPLTRIIDTPSIKGLGKLVNSPTMLGLAFISQVSTKVSTLTVANKGIALFRITLLVLISTHIPAILLSILSPETFSFNDSRVINIIVISIVLQVTRLYKLFTFRIVKILPLILTAFGATKLMDTYYHAAVAGSNSVITPIIMATIAHSLRPLLHARLVTGKFVLGRVARLSMTAGLLYSLVMTLSGADGRLAHVCAWAYMVIGNLFWFASGFEVDIFNVDSLFATSSNETSPGSKIAKKVQQQQAKAAKNNKKTKK
eukprot:TRINITY_DN8905_c0_g1_i1.p1 TRINITY_DN8905_c0_g1~~TRINITY_DN8905_c0_g1_i1.p1  ORF type:complete len:357 (-),score=88.68 TRINITY_DN8905_c0_g1_i1:104-1138(-)